LLAGYVGLSRLQENMHYMSDIVAGGVLGTYVSLKLSGRATDGRSLRLSPLVMGGGTGVAFTYGF
jgi:membrane-associated phospholipid phosphatase